MAFHPFQIVRKHQKGLLVLATIFCMVVFIFQFGSGDIFSRFGLGRGQGKPDKVVTLYGKDVTQLDINDFLKSRQLGNALIEAGLESAEKDARKELEGSYKGNSQDPADEIVNYLVQSCLGRQMELDNSIEKLSSNDQKDMMERYQASQFLKQFADEKNVSAIQSDYNILLNQQQANPAADKPDPAKAKERAQTLADVRFLLRYQYRFATRPNQFATRPAQQFYFGGGVKDLDLLDFEIWKHQAEKLGVVLTKADARRALAYEAGGHGLPADPGGSWKDDPAFKAVFAAHPQATEEQAATALQDEFRVHIAQGLLGGPASGVAALDADERASPDAVAPYDFWTYFRDNRTTLKVAFLALPVQAFEASVDTNPTTDELNNLYKKGEARVPDPTSPTPGFRQPHRIRMAVLVAWTDPRQFAPEELYFSAGLPGNVASAGVAPVGLLATALAVDPLRAEYNRVLDYLTVSHSAEASLAGDIVGLGTLGPSTLPALAGVLQASTDETNRQTSREAASALAIALTSSTPGAPFAGLVGALVPPSAWTQATFPRIVQPDLSEFPKTVVDKRKDFREEAEKKNAENKDPAAQRLNPDKYADEKVQEFIEQQAKKNGWELKTSGLDDKFAVEKDDALKSIGEVIRYHAKEEEIIRALQQGEPFQDKEAPDLASVLFNRMTPDLYVPAGPFPDPKAPRFVIVWRTEDIPEGPPLVTSPADSKEVKDAWRLQQARIKALQKAAEIGKDAAAEWKTIPAGAGQLEKQQENLGNFLKGQSIGKAILPPTPGAVDIARLIRKLNPLDPHDETYVPYAFPADQFPDIAPDNAKNINDPANLVNRLLGAPGDGLPMLIFMDKPQKTCYLALVEQRDEPKFQGDQRSNEFGEVYRNATNPPRSMIEPLKSGPMWQAWFLPQHKKTYQKALMRQLREDAAGKDNVNEQGRLKLSDAAQKQQQQGSGQPNDSEGDDEP